MQKEKLSKIDWWQRFFAKDYLRWSEANGKLLKSAKKEVKFLIEVLKLKKKDKILDLGCGQGRHSILLAKKGYNVTGIDYSDYLLKIAKNRAKKEKVKINFIKKDAKKLDFENEFDVILNLFTSFGYETDKNNEKIIEKVSKALKKGGKFLIDLINVVWLLKNYKKVIIIKKNIGIAIDENFFDPKTFVNISKRTIFFKNGKKKEDEIRLRMYTFPEMRDLLKRHNLVIKKVFGSYDKEKFNFNSKRMIILAQRVK